MGGMAYVAPLCLMVLTMFEPVFCATFAQDFLTATTSQMNVLVKSAEENDANMCELLSTCNSTLETCSREACKPSSEEVLHTADGMTPAWPFIYVANNTDCFNSDRTCHFMMFNFNRSYVRFAPSTDSDSITTAADVCVQRKLDQVFKNVSSPSDFTRVFFGSPTGAWRVFPGLDEADCTGYETRTRNWYIASTTVPKAVMILIDAGRSMINKDKFGGESFLETATRAAQEMLHTMAVGEFVNIIAFNSVNATQLVFPPAMAQERHSRGHRFPEYEDLKAKLLELSADQVHFEASNVTTAIDIALQNFDFINRPDALKVVIVLTDGAFAEGPVTLPTAAMAAAKTKLFVYDVSPTARNLTASFTSQLRTIGGSFINIYRDVKNPLYAMESFYSFTGMLHHRLMHPLADFTYKLQEFSRFNETVLLASKPAFRADGSLIGVAGVSIYLVKVKDSMEEIKAIVTEQQRGRQFDARTMVTLGPANCTIQVEPKSVYVCGPSTTVPPNRGLCLPRNSGTSITNRSCLHPTCALPPPPTPPNLKAIVGGSVGGAIAAILAASAIYLIWRWRRYQRELQRISPHIGHPVVMRAASH